MTPRQHLFVDAVNLRPVRHVGECGIPHSLYGVYAAVRARSTPARLNAFDHGLRNPVARDGLWSFTGEASAVIAAIGGQRGRA